MKEIKIIYQDKDLVVADKPAGIIVYPDLIKELFKKFPDLKNTGHSPRYGIVHRLDKDTSGILLVAKNDKALDFFQSQFKQRKVEKKYLALVKGEIKEKQGIIETLIGRSGKDGKKQKVYLSHDPDSEGKRKAVTKYKVLEKFNNYTLLEAQIETGRKHQIRVHFASILHPIVGDKVYGFKNQLKPKGLERQFLHASRLKITLPSGEEKEFKSKLPEDLKIVLKNLNYYDNKD
ncbi:RluA family pseudouridine synthase [Candidatus Parcubacteria bacterium]|nr:RluA family pseudouridine synthase [Candidatus Parcubacteria bacterium]